jgi:peptidoglycan/LPS O-acetylase OafA/YrhL
MSLSAPDTSGATARHGVQRADPTHLAYLDALRGYAIVGVIAIHVVQRSPGLPPALGHFLFSGQQGVQLFFMVSAVTLLHSWTERNDGAGPFYLRRLFRIGPMWYLAILVWTMLRLLAPQASEFAHRVLPASHLLLTSTYLHIWFPETINDVVPGGWSIGNEATFYLLFPLLATLLVDTWRAGAFVLLAMGVSYVFGTWWHPALTGSPSEDAAFLYFWFPNQLPAFAFGILTFQLIRAWQSPRWLAEFCVLGALAAIVLVPALTRWDGPIVYGWIFMPLIFGLAHGGGGYLVNGLMRWIGQRSYSAYFWHLGLLGLVFLLPAPDPYLGFALKYGVLFVITFALSHLSYRWIEQPGIRLGKRLLVRLHHPTTRATLPAATSGL